MLAGEAERFEAACRGDHPHARALEQAGEDAAVHRAVVDDERREVLARRQPRIERRLVGGIDLSPSPPR